MKSIEFHKYGFENNLKLKEVDTPTPESNEVLINIHASSVNEWDYGLLQGKPWVNRVLFGLFKPNVKTLGVDISGTVSAVGHEIKELKVGDRVVGDISAEGWGGFAEYVCVEEKCLYKLPESIGLFEAASIPQAGVLAMQGVLDHLKLTPGTKVLINGAGGGCGTLAIQIAKQKGAHVTAVDTAEKQALMHSLGASEVLDFKKEDFTKNGANYDLILDFAGYHSIFDYRKCLTEKGVYLLVGGASSLILQCLFLGPFLSFGTGKKLKILQHVPNKYLPEIFSMIESGQVKPTIDSSFALCDVPKALQYYAEGKCKGKIMIKMD